MFPLTDDYPRRQDWRFRVLAGLLIGWSVCGCSTTPQSHAVPTASPSPPSTRVILNVPSNTVTPASPAVETPAPTSEADAARPNLPELVLSFNSLNQATPDDIKNEVEYFVGGGPGPACGESSEPEVEYVTKDVALGDTFEVLVCGWEPDEVVSLVLEGPEHYRYATTLIAVPNRRSYAASFSYSTDPLQMPPGEYALTLTGRTDTVQAAMTIEPPSGPRIFAYSPNELLLFGFMPNELVRVLIYQAESTFRGAKLFFTLLGWSEGRVDSTGYLKLRKPDIDQTLLVAIGALSGETHEDRRLDAVLRDQDMQPELGVDCSGALATRLLNAARARVTFTDGKPLLVRDSASQQARIVGRLVEGTAVSLIAGPVCAEHIWWWKVQGDGGASGWSAEGAADVYFLEPVN